MTGDAIDPASAERNQADTELPRVRSEFRGVVPTGVDFDSSAVPLVVPTESLPQAKAGVGIHVFSSVNRRGWWAFAHYDETWMVGLRPP
jgi:hypothetical protein